MKKRIVVAALFAAVIGFCVLQRAQAGDTVKHVEKRMLLSGKYNPKDLFYSMLSYIKRLEDPNEKFYTPKIGLFRHAKGMLGYVKELIELHEKGEITFPEYKLIDAAKVDEKIKYLDQKIAELQ